MDKRVLSCGEWIRVGAGVGALFFAGLAVAGCGSKSASNPTPTTMASAPETRPTTVFRPPPHPTKSPTQQAVADLRRQLYRGNVAFNAPTSLGRNESAEIALLVGLAKAKELKAELPDTGSKESARIDLADQMAADLTGIGFRIQPETARVQSIGVLKMTQWRWQIEPTRTGRLHLHLTLNALLKDGGSTQAVSIRTFDRTVPITVTFNERVSSFFGDNWQWLFSTILLPFGVYLWHMRRKRVGEAAPEGPKAPLQP